NGSLYQQPLRCLHHDRGYVADACPCGGRSIPVRLQVQRGRHLLRRRPPGRGPLRHRVPRPGNVRRNDPHGCISLRHVRRLGDVRSLYRGFRHRRWLREEPHQG
ncbi:unnamed protein product, partial [Scytosiphon promiscuus]